MAASSRCRARPKRRRSRRMSFWRGWGGPHQQEAKPDSTFAERAESGIISAMHRRITGRLVIATHNPGKLAEMRELLAPHGVEAVSAGELGLGEPEETGKTFRANAVIKAIAAAKAANL